MRTRHLGRSGLVVSTLGLGTLTWGTEVDEEGARDLITAFVAAGGTLVDTAHSFGGGAAEATLGRLLASGAVSRDDVVLVGKAGVALSDAGPMVDVSRRTLLRHLDESLTRLGTDHMDVWVAHAWSDTTPLEETLGALEYAVSSGRARYVGVSGYSGWQVARAFSLAERARLPFVMAQTEHSLLHRDGEHELLPAGVALGFGVVGLAPLGRGVLTGKYRGGIPAPSRAASRHFPRFLERHLDERAASVTEAVVTAARGLDVPPAHVALAWARDTAGMASVVVGTRTRTQLQTALESLSTELPGPVREALDEVSA